MCHFGSPPAHHSGSFWVLLAGNITITSLGKLQKLFEWATWEHHGYFLWENSRCSHQFPNGDITVTWPGTLWTHCKELFEWATQGHCSYFLWGNSRCSHQLPNGNIPVTWPRTLWMYWPFPRPGKLQGNWQGKFWMYLWCTGWEYAWYFVHFLVMYLRCTSSGHQPLSPVLYTAYHTQSMPPTFIVSYSVNPFCILQYHSTLTSSLDAL